MNKFYKVLVAVIFISFTVIVFYTFDQEENSVSFTVEASEPINHLTIYQRSKFKVPVRGEKNIIFLETSCIASENGFEKHNAKIVLNHQRACAVESAARTNPASQIYIFYTCPLDSDSLSRSDELVTRLFQYSNVFVWHQTMFDIFLSTPLEDFHKSGKLQASNYPTTHGSDVLRFLMLWKYGGTYLDLDFIVMRSLHDLGSNFVGVECCGYLNSAAVNFGTDALGQRIADECMEEIRTNFKGDNWGHNGPALVTRVLRNNCNINETEKMTREACNGFTVLPHTVFYPIIYQWKLYYDEAKSAQTMETIQKGHALHLWNSLMGWEGGGFMVRGSQQPIVLLEKEFCPVTYAVTGGEAISATPTTATSAAATPSTTTTLTTATSVTGSLPSVSVTVGTDPSVFTERVSLPPVESAAAASEGAVSRTTVLIPVDAES